MTTWTATHRIILVALCGVVGLGRPADALAQDGNPALESYLNTLGIDAQQRATIARGRAVAKLLPTADSRDVTVFGMISVNATRDTVVARTFDLDRYLAARGARFHIFGNPVSPADFSEVRFDESEYRGLRKCRPTDCDFKLPASEMMGLAQQIDWSARGAKAKADSQWQAWMLRLVEDYRSRGNEAMPSYDDGQTVKAADAFSALLAQTGDLYELPPELEHYLATYPAERPDSARDFLYWSEDRLPRLRPVVTLNHAVAYTPSRAGAAAFVARKQIYASHYFEGGFELLAIVDGGVVGGEPITYLLSVRRFRFDYLPGGLFNIRGRVRRQLVDATRVDLERERSAMQPATR